MVLLLPNALGSEQYGQWVILLAVCGSAVHLGSGFISVYFVQHGTRSFIRQGYFGNTYVISTVLGFIGGLITLPIVSRLRGLESAASTTGWLVGITGLTVIANYGRFGLQVAERFLEYSACLLLDRFVFALVCLGLWATTTLHLHSLAFAHSLALLLAAAVAVTTTVSKDLDFSVRDFDNREFVGVVGPNSLAYVANYFVGSAFFVVALSATSEGAAIIGSVGIAFRLHGLVQQPLRWISPAIFPALDRARERHGPSEVTRITCKRVMPQAWMVTLFFLVTSGLVCFSPVVSWIYASEYDSLRTWLVIAFASLGGEVLNTILVKALWALDRNTSVLLSCLAATVPVGVAFFATTDPIIRGLGICCGIWSRTACQCWFLQVRDCRAWRLFAWAAGASLIVPLVLSRDWESGPKVVAYLLVALAAVLITLCESKSLSSAFQAGREI